MGQGIAGPPRLLMGALFAVCFLAPGCSRPTLTPPASATPTASLTPTLTPALPATPSVTPTLSAPPPTLTAAPTQTATPTQPTTATPSPSPIPPTLTPAPTATPPPAVTVVETTVTILTYPYADFLQPQFSEAFGIPYARLDWGAYEAANPRPASKSYRAIVLENAWLRLTLLPDLGGRIYRLVYKPTGHNLLYNNPVIKPTRWGPPEQGWWLAAGGIEFCLPVEEHGYETAIPWGYAIERRPDAALVRLWDALEGERVRAQVEVVLRAGEARFGLGVRLHNASRRDLRLKYWTNAMLAPGGQNTVSDGLQFVFPATQMTVHSSGDDALPGPNQALTWPAWGSRDLSWLRNWRGWLGFFERPRAGGAFAGVYDQRADEGVARVFPPAIAAGVKGFGFGWGAGALPASLWTDDSSTYVELHGGLAPTFDDAVDLPAGASIAWQEDWLPLAGLGGLTTAGPAGAAHLHWDEATGHVRLRILPARAFQGQLEARVGATTSAFPIAWQAGRNVEVQLASPAQPVYNAPIEIILTETNGAVEQWRGPYRPVIAP